MQKTKYYKAIVQGAILVIKGCHPDDGRDWTEISEEEVERLRLCCKTDIYEQTIMQLEKLADEALACGYACKAFSDDLRDLLAEAKCDNLRQLQMRSRYLSKHCRTIKRPAKHMKHCRSNLH